MRWKTDPSPVPRPASDTARRGVTLVETLLVVGILMILVGLLMPALARVQQQQRIVAEMADVRNYHIGITLIAQDHDEMTQMPVKTTGTVGYAMYWGHQVLLEHGYAPSKESLDRYGVRQMGYVRFGTAGSLTMPPSHFHRDLPEHFAEAEPLGVRLSSIAAPSSLVTTFQWLITHRDQWCCGPPPSVYVRGSLSFADGHVDRRAVTEFEWPSDGVKQSNYVGVPALSTLNGVRGRDRVVQYTQKFQVD